MLPAIENILPWKVVMWLLWLVALPLVAGDKIWGFQIESNPRKSNTSHRGCIGSTLGVKR